MTFFINCTDRAYIALAKYGEAYCQWLKQKPKWWKFRQYRAWKRSKPQFEFKE